MEQLVGKNRAEEDYNALVELNNSVCISIDVWQKESLTFLVNQMQGEERSFSCQNKSISLEKSMLACEDDIKRPINAEDYLH